VWIFSDHGQEDTVSYVRLKGSSVQEAIERIYDESSRPAAGVDQHRRGEQGERALHLGWGRLERFIARGLSWTWEADPARPLVTAMGPVGHVYWPRSPGADEIAEIARRMVGEGGIPLVLCPEGSGAARAWNASGVWNLPEDGAAVLGEGYRDRDQVARDLIALVQHPDAGDFVLSGWRPEGRPVTFPQENGSHAGPGTRETEGFALLPRDAPLGDPARGWLRPAEMREAALRWLGRLPAAQRQDSPLRPVQPGRLRVMTYNVHRCQGMDGRLWPERIARIIALHNPDVVALQELDLGRARTDGIDQARLIARELEMDHHFHPALRVEEEQYGDAILSRLPMRLRRAGTIGDGKSAGGLRGEPRGALWVTVELDGRSVQIVNTHLGIFPGEQRKQLEILLGADWLGSEECAGPLVVCGDFNALPRTRTWRAMRRRLEDAQDKMDGHRPRNTFFARAPMGRIDYVWISEDWTVEGIEVTRSHLTREASDHLPLVADLRLEGMDAVAIRRSPDEQKP
jgi:endonuclease/exonuclease/phosphatase family metal-dependent hydrolase